MARPHKEKERSLFSHLGDTKALSIRLAELPLNHVNHLPLKVIQENHKHLYNP